MRRAIAVVAGSLLLVVGRVGAEKGAALYVSPRGSDEDPGTRLKPFATLERARDALRDSPGRGGTVFLRGGAYRIELTFELGERDSGTRETRAVFRSYGNEVVRLIAGRVAKRSRFRPVRDPAVLRRLEAKSRGKVVELDLAALGITHTGPWPDLFRDGGGIIELHFNGKRMPLARWPNEGYTTVKTVLDSGVWGGPNRRGGTFVYRGERPARWGDAVAEGLWLDGFWRVPWQPETVRVASIDTDKRTITHAHHVGGGLGSKYSKEVNGTRKGSGKENWYATNVLEEIDRPGEWCLRFATRTLYFWPPGPLEGASILVADLAEPVVRIKGASHVVLRGLVMEGGLGNGVEIEGGTDNLVAGCTFRSLGGTGVVIRGGTANGVRSCDLHELGHGGIYIGGGDRRTLTPARNFAVNNHVHHIGRVKKTYAPAVKLGAYGPDAVGCRVAHNLIHDLPHAAVLYGGNDNVLEFNEIHHVALDSGDVGAFYTWHDWTSRGNVVRYNFVHQSPGANGVYMDDGDSGDEVHGNIFYRTRCGPFVGGGHDNIIRNNIAVECATGIHIDDRGVSRGYNARHRRLTGQLKSVDYKRPPWSERYPEMTNILEFHPDWPTGTVVEGNVTVRCRKAVSTSGKKAHYRFTRIEGNLDLPEGDAGFVDAESLDLALREDSPVFRKLPGFKAIPFDRIGLRVDEYRRSLPKAGRRDP